MEQMPLKETDRIYCTRCHRDMQMRDFYKDKNRNPMKTCKKCMASMIDLNSYSTILPVLEEIDIPYIPYEFESLKDRYMFTEKDGKRVRNPNCNQSILGKYIGKMKLAQYKEYTYADTKRFIEEDEGRRFKASDDTKERLDELMQEGYEVKEALAIILHGEAAFDDDGTVDAFMIPEKDPSISKEQTEEVPLLTRNQHKELKLKWGDMYSMEELIRLETFYAEMHASYDINTASHEDYLKKIVKISLRMDQAIDVGDYESVSKLSANYDKFMKSAKFTASQGKEEEVFIDSFSEMSRLAEEQGFIPVYHTSEPKDIVDVTLRDLNNYTRNLIMKEPGLATLIENAFEAIKLEEEKDRMGEDDEEDLFEKDFITDKDFFEDFEANLENQWDEEEIELNDNEGES